MINKIKKYISKHPLAIISLYIPLMILIILSNILENDMEEHIEKVSKKCASQGYGIKASYTKDGDKFYKCDTEVKVKWLEKWCQFKSLKII